MDRYSLPSVASVACLFALTWTVGNAEPPRTRVEPADSVVVNGALGRKLDRFLTYTARFRDGMSGSVLVAARGEVLLEKGYGLAAKDAGTSVRADALWDVASVTKQFTAAAVLRLEMQGKLSLEDPLKKFFPSTAAHNADVTLRQLLNHTSGIKNDARFEGVDLFNRDATAQYIVNLPQVSKPGDRWAYSNLAYFLLGAIIEKASGQTWEEYLKEHLFRPAGMKDAVCLGEQELADVENRIPLGSRGTSSQFPYGNLKGWGYVGAGGVHATVRDMYLWDRALRTGKILSEKALEQYYAVGHNNYALGWFVDRLKDGRRRVWHTGSVRGFSCYYLRCLEEDIVIVVLTNESRRDNIDVSKRISEPLLRALQGEQLAAPPGTPVKLDAKAIEAYTGRYPLPDGGALIVKPHPVAGLVVGCDDFNLVRRLKLAENSKSVKDEHVQTLNDKTEKCLEALRSGDAGPLRAELAKAPADLAERWLEFLAPAQDPRGVLREHEFIGNYSISENISYQFARLVYETGRQNVLFVWEGENLLSISPAGEVAATWQVLPGGDNCFFAPDGDSWKKLRAITFEANDQGKATRLTLTGLGRPIVSEPISPR